MNYTVFTVFHLFNDSKYMKSDDRRELVGYMQRYAGLSKSAALAEVRVCTEQTLLDMLKDYRGRASREQSKVSAQPKQEPKKPSEKPQKVPYTFLLLSHQLQLLKVLAARDGASVSHHIRAALVDYLKKHC